MSQSDKFVIHGLITGRNKCENVQHCLTSIKVGAKIVQYKLYRAVVCTCDRVQIERRNI